MTNYIDCVIYYRDLILNFFFHNFPKFNFFIDSKFEVYLNELLFVNKDFGMLKIEPSAFDLDLS